MLADKDRIFTNLYGAMTGASKPRASAAPGTTPKALLDKGGDWIIDEMKKSGLRGRAARASQRPQVVVHAEEGSEGTGHIISS